MLDSRNVPNLELHVLVLQYTGLSDLDDLCERVWFFCCHCICEITFYEAINDASFTNAGIPEHDNFVESWLFSLNLFFYGTIILFYSDFISPICDHRANLYLSFTVLEVIQNDLSVRFIIIYNEFNLPLTFLVCDV